MTYDKDERRRRRGPGVDGEEGPGVDGDGGPRATERELALRLLASHALADPKFFQRLRRDPQARPRRSRSTSPKGTSRTSATRSMERARRGRRRRAWRVEGRVRQQLLVAAATRAGRTGRRARSPRRPSRPPGPPRHHGTLSRGRGTPRRSRSRRTPRTACGDRPLDVVARLAAHVTRGRMAGARARARAR
jgi:hypothetical protein